MKNLKIGLCLIVFGIFNISSFAEVIEIKNTEGVITSYKIEIILLPEEYKAMTVDCYSVEEWVVNAVKNKARRMIDELVTKSGEGSEFTDLSIKKQIVKDLKIKTAKEKTDEFEEEERRKNE